MNILLFVVGIVLVLEFVIALLKAGKSASGLTYFICRPFGWPLSMFWGLLVRIALIVGGVVMIVKTIPVIF